MTHTHSPKPIAPQHISRTIAETCCLPTHFAHHQHGGTPHTARHNGMAAPNTLRPNTFRPQRIETCCLPTHFDMHTTPPPGGTVTASHRLRNQTRCAATEFAHTATKPVLSQRISRTTPEGRTPGEHGAEFNPVVPQHISPIRIETCCAATHFVARHAHHHTAHHTAHHQTRCAATHLATCIPNTLRDNGIHAPHSTVTASPGWPDIAAIPKHVASQRITFTPLRNTLRDNVIRHHEITPEHGTPHGRTRDDMRPNAIQFLPPEIACAATDFVPPQRHDNGITRRSVGQSRCVATHPRITPRNTLRDNGIHSRQRTPERTENTSKHEMQDSARHLE